MIPSIFGTGKDPETPPREFLAIFGQLVRRTRQASRLESQTAADYYALLSHLPLEVLAASATELARTSVFLPSVHEWLAAAAALTRPAPAASSSERCAECEGRGLIRINYRSGDPYDIAICRCAAGRYFMFGGRQGAEERLTPLDVEAFVRARLQLSAEHQVAYLEEFTDEDDPPMTERPLTDEEARRELEAVVERVNARLPQ